MSAPAAAASAAALRRYRVRIQSDGRRGGATVHVQARTPEDALRIAFDHQPAALEILDADDASAVGRFANRVTARAEPDQPVEVIQEAA